MTRLDEIFKRAETATPGPWYFDEDCSVVAGEFKIGSGFEKMVVNMHYNPAYHPDLKFIAHAREALAAIEKEMG